MSTQSEQPRRDAVELSKQGFPELVRAGYEDYVLKRIGLPLPLSMLAKRAPWDDGEV